MRPVGTIVEDLLSETSAGVEKGKARESKRTSVASLMDVALSALSLDHLGSSCYSQRERVAPVVDQQKSESAQLFGVGEWAERKAHLYCLLPAGRGANLSFPPLVESSEARELSESVSGVELDGSPSAREAELEREYLPLPLGGDQPFSAAQCAGGSAVTENS